MSQENLPASVQNRTVVVRGPEANSANVIQPIAIVGGVLIGLAIASVVGGVESAVGGAIIFSTTALGTLLALSVRVAKQWEKALVFRLGRFLGIRGPGVFFIMPILDSTKIVDTRVQTLEIPHRQAITKDNVPVRIDGVIFMRVSDPGQAIINVQNYIQAVQEYAQTTLRDVVGSMTLDEILADREQLGHRVQQMVEQEIDGWGVDVAAIRIQDIVLPEDLKRVMARQASAEREKRATITKSQGDAEAAQNLSAAADLMARSPGALQLRTLQTLDGLGTSPSNTVVLALPTEVFNALEAVPKLSKAIAESQEKQEQNK